MSDKINNRLEDLYDVLLYDSNEQSFGRAACFSVFERILINQERGALYSQINQENEQEDIRHYQCPEKLESKIKFVIQKVIDINLITQ
jgi:hypothetical protein